MAIDEIQVPYTGSTVYHYTDAAGLIGMVQSHALWATETSGLNDPREGQYGRRALGAHTPPEAYCDDFEFHRDRIDSVVGDEVYVACCSTRQDDVSQWTRYTPWPNTGYCVGLDTATRLAIARPDRPRTPSYGGRKITFGEFASTTSWSPVLYGQRAVDKALNGFYPWAEKVVSEATKSVGEKFPGAEYQQAQDRASTKLLELARLAKDEGFASESEVRVVASSLDAGRHVKYRPSRFGVVRHVELVAGPSTQGFVVRDEEDRASWARLPIVSVMIGPSPFARTGQSTVRRLLKDNGYDIEPTISTVHVR